MGIEIFFISIIHIRNTVKITYLGSASILVEDNGTKVLCDPWLVDGEFYGSWAHYPPVNYAPNEFNDVDFIYVSHIHPDHFSVRTLSKMNKKIPILLHDFHYKYLKDNIVQLGFTPIELQHNKRTHLKNDTYINILAADNCDPQLCFKYFGCGLAEKKFGSTSIDSMSVIDNGKEVMVNTNDCPFSLGQTSASIIKNAYREIDMLLVGYSSATAYPQCFDLTESERENAKKSIIQKFLSQSESYVNLLKPRFFLPFAGRYVLSGKNWILNEKRAVPELEDAYEYFINSPNIDQSKQKCVILNLKSSFNTKTGKASQSYDKIDKNEKRAYIEQVLANQKYDYELESEPATEEILELIPRCYERFERKRKEQGFNSDTKVLLDVNNDRILSISCDGNGYSFISKEEASKINKFVSISLDKKLLRWLLLGPKLAHWNNAEIGSHLRYKRKPDIYERGLFYCLNFFHV